MTDVASLDSGFDAMEGIVSQNEVTFHIRVTMPEDPAFQAIFIIRPLDLVWTLKQKVLSNVARELKDSMNYGLYCPPSNNRVGKFLDEERPIKEYPLSVPIGLLEFKYKRKLYKTDHNPLKLKKLHMASELKLFLDLVRKGDLDQITLKMSKGFDPNFNSSGKGETPLTLAATLPRPGAVILALVGGGAFIDYRNKSGMTPLHVATLNGNKDAVRILLDLGSSPNYKDSKGLTPLSYATVKGTNALIMQWLLQERADIGWRDEKGWMEIHHACERGLTQHLEQLLFYGADRNAPTLDTNETPLHICARFNQRDCAWLLLHRGADKTLKNKLNQVPEQVAKASQNENLAKLITDFQPDQVELFNDIPKYNEKRRGTISMATLRNLQRSRSNPNLLQELFLQDPVLSATVSQAVGVQYVSNGLIPNGVKSPPPHARPVATDIFATGNKNGNNNGSLESSTRNYVERTIELYRQPNGFGFILRGPIDPPGSSLNFMPTPDIPARQYIESVEPDSAASRAGLAARDFILEINGQNVIFESHKDCVQLMRNCGEILKLKVVKVQHSHAQVQSKSAPENSNTLAVTNTRDSVLSNSLTSTDSAQAKTALDGLEALENLDATLDNYDGLVMSSIEEPTADVSAIAPEEFPCESSFSETDVVPLFPPPPPLAFSDSSSLVDDEFQVPEPLLTEEVVVTLNSGDSIHSIHNGRTEAPCEPEPDYEKPDAETVVVVESESSSKAEQDGDRKKSASLAFAAASIGSARQKSSGESSRASILTPPVGVTGETTLQKQKKAPAPPQVKAPNSREVSPSKVAIVSAVAASSTDRAEMETKENQSRNSTSTMPMESAVAMTTTPIPPPPPPPPLLPLASIATLSRVKPASESAGGDKTLPSNVQRQLDESRKRDESHAVLMAAVLKRKNILDATDSDVLAESIDARVDRTRKLQKTVYRADNTKEVKSPPTTVAGVGLLKPGEGNHVEDDSAGFSAEAEKMRQAFLLKKSAVVASKGVGKEVPSAVSAYSSSTVNRSKQESVSSRAVSGNSVADSPKISPAAIGSTGSGDEVRTINRATLNRPASAVVTSSQPVLGDVAALIAQKALARQMKEEAKTNSIVESTEAKEGSAVEGSATLANRRSMFEAGSSSSAKPLTTLPKSPKNSKVYGNANVKADDGVNGATNSRPVSATLSPKKLETGTASTLKVTSPTLKIKEPGNLNSSNRNSSSSSSTLVVGKSTSPLGSPRQATTLSRPPDTIGRKEKLPSVSGAFIPPPVGFASPPDTSFSTEVYATATLRSTTKPVSSNSLVFRAKSSIASEPVTVKTFQDRLISAWNEKDVEDWLESLNFSEYRVMFAERKVTGPVLAQMKADQIESMGIKNPLHRILLEKEIRKVASKK